MLPLFFLFLGYLCHDTAPFNSLQMQHFPKQICLSEYCCQQDNCYKVWPFQLYMPKYCFGWYGLKCTNHDRNHPHFWGSMDAFRFHCYILEYFLVLYLNNNASIATLMKVHSLGFYKMRVISSQLCFQFLIYVDWYIPCKFYLTILYCWQWLMLMLPIGKFYPILPTQLRAFAMPFCHGIFSTPFEPVLSIHWLYV